MKIAIITTDNREHDRNYNERQPQFCAGHLSLLQGLWTISNAEFHVISCTQQPMSSPERLAQNMFFHSLHVPKLGWLRTGYQGCIRAIRRKVQEIQPDIVHGHGTERECAIGAAFSGFPNLVTVHGNMAEQLRMFGGRIGSYRWLQKRVEDVALRRTIGVLCNSAYTESLVKPRSQRTWVVPHALRIAFFEPIPETPRRCVLLNAGVICERKRQLELLNVAEQLHRKGLDFEFRFIGFIPSADDPYANQFLGRIKRMEQAGFARFLGPQPEESLVRCYDDVSGVIHFPTEEAFGNVVIEALSRNLKFFGSKLGGIQDIATNAPAAELYGRDDWSGLASGIQRWIETGFPRPAGAKEFIRERYHPESIARRHIEIYREVLNGSAPTI